MIRHAKCYIKNYPRPQFVRAEWENLNGEWSFAFGEEVKAREALAGKLPRKIEVPFTYETKKSGIGDETPHDTVWYARKVTKRAGKRNILNVEGADYLATVYVNGKEAGSHEGAYSRFSLDITDLLHAGENLLVIRCDDMLTPLQVRGKQRWVPHNHGCNYLQMTGLWKSVWMEYADEVRLSSLRMTPYPNEGELELIFSVTKPQKDVTVEYEVEFRGEPICSGSVTADASEQKVRVRVASERAAEQVNISYIDWPSIYDITFTVKKKGKVTDRVGSYFAMTDFSVRGGQFSHCMIPKYLKMVLDQGWWPESGFTPPDEEAIVKDIELTKAMGFNAVRKHEKIEDERYLYYADVLGLGVWCEMPSAYFLTEETMGKLTAQWTEIVRQNYNHPSIIAWVCCNESWGVRTLAEDERTQNFVSALYWQTKAYDARRPVIGNDGWAHTFTDLLTVHQYTQDGDKLYSMYSDIEKITEGDARTGTQFALAKGWEYAGQPVVLSEFGGTAFRADEKGEAWGYGNAVKDEAEYLARLRSLFTAAKKMPLVGYCYTQLCDVQQEVNGLLKEDRTPKVPLEEIRKINEEEV